MTNIENITVAICAATGNQGREVIKRFQEINEAKTFKNKVFQSKALTRSASSNAAIDLSKMPNVTVAETNYSSIESLKNVLEGVDALYLNYAMVENEAEIETSIVDAAIESGVKHIIYASTSGCGRDHGVPHWTSSYKTEEYLKECHSKCTEKKEGEDFKYHFVRLGHFNENILPGSYFPPQNGKITYPWGSDIRVATSSLRDIARVACKLFTEPWRLDNGSSIDALTEFFTPNDIAKCVSNAKGEAIIAAKGPWIFTTFGHWFGWEASTVLSMAKYIDANEFVEGLSITDMHDFLQNEIEAEPLETIESFARRHFS
jgi:nucleoside-diphosphate-sugar epimerase